MKFLHTADWHIGAGRGYIPHSAARTFEAIEAIYNTAMVEGIRTVVVAGDMFDSPNIEEAERRALLLKIAAYDSAGIATLMIPGNHDRISDHHTTLDYLDAMTRAGSFSAGTVITQNTQLVIRERVGFLLFTNEPWGRVSDHVATIRRGSIRHDIDALVVVAHQTIQGSRTATGITMASGLLFEPDQHVDMYCFGDIHICQQLTPTAWYSGSPLQINFGEPDQQGVLIFDTKNLKNPTFHSIPSRRLVTVEAGEEVPKDAIVRVMYDEKPMLAQDLPENVVKVAWTPIQVDLTNLRSEAGMLAGLEDVLAQRLDEDDTKEAMRLCHETLQQLGGA